MVAPAQQTGSQGRSPTSSSSSSGQVVDQESSSNLRITQPEAGGSAVTLETSEPLFDIAAGLNACGYDADLSASNPLRATIRQDINDALGSSPAAQNSRDALCAYIRQHTLTDSSRSLAQYISLAMFLTPELTPTVGETDLPPDAAQVVNVLPLLRTFNEQLRLHTIWIQHHPAYEGLVSSLHDPLTRMILDANIYLKSPVSSYDGRRFLVLLEPMLAPSAVNARIYGSNYIIVVSPTGGDSASSFHMEQIRHTYLHYEIEPMVYARAAAMDRLLPLLKPVQDAPLDFTYKSDIVSLLAECLIKAIEYRTMDAGMVKPTRPAAIRQRAEMERYDSEMALYERQTEAARRRSVDLSMRQGWVLVEYFYDQLSRMEKDGVSLKDNIGPMIYGMDVDRERRRDQQIAFLPEGSHEVVRRSVQKPTGLRLAEMKLMQGDAAGAEEIAGKALSDPKGDHAQANYLMARIQLLERHPDEAIAHFQAVLDGSKDPRTLAWSHIYLGRLYDVKPDRKKAVQEYQAALSVRDGQPDTKAAADTGLRTPFALPKREAVTPAASQTDEEPLDPTGKAEKDAYRPPQPK